MNWILEHLQVLIGAAAAIAYLLNRSRASSQEQPKQPRRGLREASDDQEQAERTRRVQDEIRRKIAERRAEASGSGQPRAPRDLVPPVMRPANLPPIDPFGGPMRRVVRKIEEAAAKLEERVDDPEASARAAELARQAKLAERLRELERARVAEERRRTEILAARRQLDSVSQPTRVAAGEIHRALRDPRELRRAFILREILNRPVGLR